MMTKLILALAAIACASPAMAQVNGYYDSHRSIYGGPTTYQWRETPTVPAYQPPSFYQPPPPPLARPFSCSTIGSQTYCN